MKNFNNLITMTNVMRHNSQNAVNPDGQPTVNRQSRLMLRQGYLRNLAMIFAVLTLSIANIGIAWGATTSSIKLGYGLFDGISSQTTVNSSSTYSGTSVQNTDKTFTISTTLARGVIKDGCIQINSGSNTATVTITAPAGGTMTSIAGTFGSSKMNTVSTTPTNTNGSPISSNTYTWTGSANSVTFNLTSGASANTEFKSIVITYSVAANKRIYMKAGAWNNDTPKFFIHSWGASDNDVQMTAVGGCEDDVFYADIPSGNTSLIFTRQNPSTSSIIWDGSDLWNRTDNISISTYDLFTFATWDGGPSSRSTFTGGTYSAPTYTISFAGNDNTGGSMSSISSIACEADQAVTANAYTKTGYRFTGWKANVDVKVGGSIKTAGTLLADKVTIQDISSNITLTAQWEEVSYCYEFAPTSTSGTIPTGTTVATSTGGNMIVLGGTIKYSTNGLSFESSSDSKVSVTLNNYMQVGSVITLEMYIGTASSRGFKVANSSGTVKATFSESSIGTYTKTYTVVAGDGLAGSNVFQVHRNNNAYLKSLKVSNCGESAACGATAPGAISKGSLSGCSVTLTAAGSAASNNTWYWQSSESGTDKTESGATKDVTTTGTYYIRSFCSTGSGCWSDARTVTVSASDLTPAAPTALAAASPTAKGVTLTVTDAANTNDYEFYVNTSSSAPSAGTSASYTSTNMSVTITNLVAGTTYYAWARAKCGSNKSTWTALGDGGTFTTSTVSAAYHLTNVSKTSGAESGIGGSTFTAVFSANTDYSMPTPVVTIGGNAATSGTDYTWTEGTGTLTIAKEKITGNIDITLNSVPSAPTSATISGAYHYFPGESISLTVTPTGNNGPTTYQWYKGGKENGNAIEGATTATYTKATCAFDDAGSYYCKVTCNATSIWAESGNSYDVKILRLYVKGSKNGEDYGNVDFMKGEGTTATASIALGSGWTYGFNIADGCGHYYGNTGTMTEGNHSNWTMDVLNGEDCGLTTTNAATYTFTINYSNLAAIVVTDVTYPSANQASGKVIYFDNSGLGAVTPYYRIGHTSHSQSTAMTQVYGTANLYKVTTAEYNGFTGWFIANAQGGTGSDKSIYNTVNAPAITKATAHEGGAVTADAVTVSPTTSKGAGADAGVNDNCTFYNYTITDGMKTDRVTITAPTNGTITVSYTDVNNASQSFTSGNRDLAHTVIITPTATPNTGYALSSLTVNEAAHTSGNTHTVTANTTIAATFSPIQVSSISVAPSSKTLEVGGTQQLTATVSPDNALDKTVTWSTSNGSVATVSSTGLVTAVAAGTCTITATANDGSGKTGTCAITVTAAASQTALVINTLYEVPDMIPSGATLTNDDQFFEGLSANTKFELIGSASSSKTPKANSKSTNDKTIDGITFDDGSMWFRGNASLTSNIPTTFGLSFIVPEGGGKLYLYFSGTSTNIKLAKSGASGSKPSCASGYGEVDVTAGTYYLYGTGETSPYCFYGLKLCSKYNVSISTTNVTKTDGATGAGAAIHGRAYTATFTANTSYMLPSDVTVSIGGVEQTKGTGYTWTVSSGTGTLTVPAAKVTGNIVVTVTGTAAATYALTYNCNGAESGCPSNTTASALPNPLPSAPTKDGYTFDGWYTDEDLTVEAVAGAAMTGATTLYAKWTERGSECEDTPHAWNVIATGAKSYKVRISKVTEEVAIPVADATASNLTAYAGSVSTNDNVTVQIADCGSSQYGYKFDGSNTYLKLVFSTPLVLNDTLVVGMTDASKNISFTTTAVRATTHSTSGGKLIIPAALAGQSTLYLWRGSGNTMYLRSFAVKHKCDALTPCTTPVIPALSNQSLCPGNDIAEWDATPTNASTITGKGESVSYSWKKKGSETVLGTSATLDLGASAAESQAGTYVVTVTVSKAGYASATATKEVTLTVNEATEMTAITADKATVYPTNSVTLTATANMDATWQWYTCSNAEGADESIISGATSASYTIASAGSAGTYYYKVKATGSCGTDEMVYTLTVSAAAGGDCFHYVSVLPDKDISPSSGASIVTPTHATTLEGGTMKVGSQQITITKNGLKLEGSKSVSITLESALEAGNVVIVKGTSATAGYGVTINGVNFYESGSKTFDVSYTVAAGDGLVGKTALTVTKYNGSSYLQEIKITGCGTACTDPEVTASVNNSTACVGSSVTFTATGAHASATYQWQKYSGGAWTDIASATAATYNIASVATTDALKYRVIATKYCDRTSNEVTLNVPVAPVFGSFTATRSVMATQALSITDVEASDATSYAWYKSADATYDAGTDTRVGTAQELLLASGGEAAGATYYLFCVASNACGSTTSSAITVNVTAFIEEDCATRGTEGAAEFGFQNSGCSQSTYNGTAVWSTGTSNSKILIYSAPDGKYFKTMKVTIASSSASQASYNWSTDGGTHYTSDGVAITGVTTTLTEKTINLSAHGNVNEVKIGRNFGNGESSGTLYVSKICFEYTSACTTTTVTPSTSSKTHTIGESFTKPTFTLGPAAVSSGTLTYSSSDEEIASVDESGNVTFNGTAGTVTITASYAGATIADVDYCASEGSYTITVSCEGGAPKIVADGSVNMSGCNSSVILNAKTQAGADFAGGSYQWFRNGEEIEGATSSSYTAKQAGVYTVAYTSAGGCTSLSTNNATVTSATVEPEVTKLVPFQYYHVDKTYTAQMKDRHLFSVKGSAAYGSTGKNFKLTMSRNGGAEKDITTEASIWVERSDDGQVDNVMIDLNKLSGKYNEGDELVLTCAAVDCSGKVSTVYKDEITIHVIGATPTLALICSGSNKASGTRKTSELTVGGDFLTGYNVADLCQQTGNTSFDANTEWGLYTRLKENYIVTPVNGYAVFNKLNYEPFDILLLTDYPKASKSDAAKDVLDDMAALCDYRPMLSFKTHMVAKSPSKWAAKGFTTSATENKADGRLNLNIVCYAHPMFESIKEGENVYDDVANSSAPLVYTMLTDVGHEGKKGMQGFELAAAENFVTIGLTHYNATITKNSPNAGEVSWTPGTEDRMLVTVAERQTNIEARFILFSLNCGAQSMLTEKGRTVILKCLEYLLETDPLKVADCSFTFDNGDGNKRTPEQQAINCSSCPPAGDGKWSNPANWGPDYRLLPGEFTSVRIKKPVEVDMEHAHVMEVRIIDEGSIDIPAGKALDVKSTIRRMDGTEIYPTEESDIHIGSASTGNGTLIFNNNDGDTKARVDMYSKGFIDGEGVKNYQYIGTPFVEINALYNYYGSWIYSWGTKKNGNLGWVVVKNGGPMTAWTGYCITQEAPTYHQMSGTLTATGTVDITVPANANMVVGNSWTAPIDINALTTDDLEGLTASIYFFNTGVDKTGGGTTTENATGDARWTGGTYVSVPIHTAPYTGDDHIPSLQGFFVKSNGSAGTLHLDYDRHVRKTTRDNILSGELHAPARRTALSSDEPVVLKMKVSGENYDDKLLLLEREDFTEGFDNGWDGDKWDGNESALYIYTTDNNGTENSVSAIPELEGTVIGFRAGEDDAYTLNFEYLNSDEPLYLYDVENNTYTQIMTGMTYRFFTTDNEKHARFIITRSNGQEVTTGVEPVPGSLDRSKAKKLLIEDKMFIMVNGMLYDATGKVVK